MMNEKQFLKSQKECAEILGMAFKEYNEYLEKLKVNENKEKDSIDNDFLNAINIKES